MSKHISISDLEKGVVLEKDVFRIEDDEYGSPSEDEEFGSDVYNNFKNHIIDVDCKKKPKFLGGGDAPFAVLKQQMKPVTEDGLVLKEELKPGIGLPISDKSVVLMHYEAYLDGAKEPFDSTRIRNKPYKFLFGEGGLVPGLELGITSMKKEEIARILVSSEYAYGRLGVSPRIPPEADILYEVEILNFYEGKDVIEFEEMSLEDQKKAPFEKILGIYHTENVMANDLFRHKNYSGAIARYRRMSKLLEDVPVDNQEDDDKRKKCLVTLYLNLAQGYLNNQRPDRAIIYADLALKFDPQNPKGLYRMGLGLSQTNQFERAEHFLNEAKNHKPYEKNINAAIKRLEERRKQHHDWEKMFCKKMLGAEENTTKRLVLQEAPEFFMAVKEEIEEFLNTDEQELRFSPGYTDKQLEVVKELADQFSLAYVSKTQSGEKINKVCKRKNLPTL